MKKLTFIVAMIIGVMTLSTETFAQSCEQNGRVLGTARKAVKDAGCLGGLNQRFKPFEYCAEITGGCACGPALTGAAYTVKVTSKATGLLMAEVDICGCTGEVSATRCLIR